MSNPSPIAGNQYFSSVRNFAANVQQVNAADVVASNLNALTVTADLYNTTLPGVGDVVQVVGYAPTEFTTLGAAGTVFLNTAPGFANAAAATNSQLLLLPNGASVVSATVTNNGTTVVGGTSFDVGTEDWSAAPAGSNNLMNDVLLASVNASATVGTPTLALGSAGAPLGSVAVATATTGVSVTVNATPNTAGDLAVLVTYVL